MFNITKGQFYIYRSKRYDRSSAVLVSVASTYQECLEYCKKNNEVGYTLCIQQL